jgi:diketogulonate reductase-like aldo/keto reductase
VKLLNITQQNIKIGTSLSMPAFLFGTYKKIDQASLRVALAFGIFSFDMAAVYNTEDLVFNEIKKL